MSKGDAIHEIVRLTKAMRKPTVYWKKDRFLHYSVSVWAAEELIQRIRTDTFDPITTIEEFMVVLDKAIEIYDGTDLSYNYSTALDYITFLYDNITCN